VVVAVELATGDGTGRARESRQHPDDDGYRSCNTLH
jgi:hypothetical protein